jgi:hypothetical protein
MGDGTPSFDEWVDYCFTRGHADFHADDEGPDSRACAARIRRFVDLDPNCLADYVVRLFSDPSGIAGRYTDDQIGAATWFLFGVASGYFQELRFEAVPEEMKIACMSSVATMYTELYDVVCCRRGADPHGH